MHVAGCVCDAAMFEGMQAKSLIRCDDMGIPDDLRWVERALAELERAHPLRALILRTEYTVSASQAVKARMVAEQYGGTLSVWQYRRELQRATDWIGGRMAA
jgi:hypothetical protein